MAPELEVHIALVLANPTVVPSKSMPLDKEKAKKIYKMFAHFLQQGKHQLGSILRD